MMIFKIVIFLAVVSILAMATVNNLGHWSEEFRKAMSNNTKKTFGNSSGWNTSWGLLLSKGMIIFFVCMLVLSLFLAFFGPMTLVY